MSVVVATIERLVALKMFRAKTVRRFSRRSAKTRQACAEIDVRFGISSIFCDAAEGIAGHGRKKGASRRLEFSNGVTCAWVAQLDRGADAFISSADKPLLLGIPRAGSWISQGYQVSTFMSDQVYITTSNAVLWVVCCECPRQALMISRVQRFSSYHLSLCFYVLLLVRIYRLGFEDWDYRV